MRNIKDLNIAIFLHITDSVVLDTRNVETIAHTKFFFFTIPNKKTNVQGFCTTPYDIIW